MSAWNPKANDIFLKALEAGTPDERRRFADEACGGDADLRAQVESLIAAGDRAGSFLECPAVDFGAGDSPGDTLALPLREGPGTVIGRYKLLERIGEGGFGVVYMAQQHQPVRRKVALKVIKAGMDTRQVVARFEAERQALALMDHPNIAKVLDGGTTDSGHPYFVMELVQGVPITEYCDKNRHTAEQRLELFVQVCQAVQHAHQKGVIHRDLKPSNVLVSLSDGVPVPKVIDFGIAKAAGQELTEKTLFTQFQQMVGTPLYMSPEQAAGGADVDTRSDVYSLGVLLYELLTGSTPFDRQRLGKAALDEVRRIIREEEPPKPSTRLSTAAAVPSIEAGRGVELRRLSRLVRGELDWIVMRSLEKDRTRRYQTANGLAMDVKRHLGGELVLARPPSLVYRAGKLARRYKALAAAAAVVVLALTLGFVVATAGFVRARAAQAVAEREKAKAVKLSGFLQSMLASARPASPGAARAVTLADLLDRASAEVADQLKDEPEVEAHVRYALAQSYGSMRMLRQHNDALERAYHLVVQTGALDSELGLRVAARVARVRRDSRPEEAEDVARQTLERARRVYGDGHDVTFEAKGCLANVLAVRKPDEAEPLLREWTAEARRMPPRTLLGFDPVTDLARILRGRGDLSGAETVYRAGITQAKGLYDQPWNAFELACVLIEQGRPVEAMPVLERIVAEHRAPETDLHGNSVYWVSGALREYHRQLVLRGLTGDLRRLYRDQVEFLSRLAGLPATGAETLRLRAHVRARVARFADALDDYNKAIELDPAGHAQWFLRGCLLAYLGDADGYAAHRGAMLSRFGDVVDPAELAERTGKACVLLPPSPEQLGRCGRLIDAGLAKGDPGVQPWLRLAKGMVEYRAGRFEACLKWCTESRDTMHESQRTAVAAAECFLAMGHQGLGDAKEARVAFERARHIMETQVPKAGAEDIGVGNIEDWLIAQVAYREASALIAGKGAPVVGGASN